VIGAEKPVHAVAGPFGDAGAAVAADVKEGAQVPILVADQQHRHAGIVVGRVVAGSRHEAAQADEQRAAPEEELALAGKLLTAGVVGDLVAVDRVRNGGGLRVKIGEELARLLALILGQHCCSSRRRRFGRAGRFILHNSRIETRLRSHFVGEIPQLVFVQTMSRMSGEIACRRTVRISEADEFKEMARLIASL
jgi:hypothetical protein